MISPRQLFATALSLSILGSIASVRCRAISPFNAGVATFEQVNPGGTWSAALAVDGNANGVFNGTTANGWAIARLNGTTTPETAYFRLTAPIQLTAQNPAIEVNLIQMFDPTQQNIIVTTQFHTIGHFRISATTADLSSSPFNLANAAAAPWTSLAPQSFSITVPSGPVPTHSVDGTNAILINTPGPALATYNLVASPGLINITGLRLELLAHASLPTSGPGFVSNGNITLTEIDARAVPEPVSLSLLGLAGAALAVRRRRSVR